MKDTAIDEFKSVVSSLPESDDTLKYLNKAAKWSKVGTALDVFGAFLMLSQLVLMPGPLTRLARLVMMLEWHRLVLVWPQVSSAGKLHSNSMNLIGALIDSSKTMTPRDQVSYD